VKCVNLQFVTLVKYFIIACTCVMEGKPLNKQRDTNVEFCMSRHDHYTQIMYLKNENLLTLFPKSDSQCESRVISPSNTLQTPR
jgi:hypothetical protein